MTTLKVNGHDHEIDAEILPAPTNWTPLIEGKIPPDTFGFDDGVPKTWPMRLMNAHWAAVLPGQPAGQYTMRCRTIDTKGNAQPMPRPFKKSGHSTIESVAIAIK